MIVNSQIQASAVTTEEHNYSLLKSPNTGNLLIKYMTNLFYNAIFALFYIIVAVSENESDAIIDSLKCKILMMKI